MTNTVKLKPFRPQTNPTPEQKKEMKKQLTRLVEEFSCPGIAHLCTIQGFEIDRQAPYMWISRGAISPQAAHYLCLNTEVREKGFTREILRPDVPVWYIDTVKG